MAAEALKTGGLSSFRPQVGEQGGVRVDPDTERPTLVHGATQPRSERLSHTVVFLTSAPTASARVACGLVRRRAARPLWMARPQKGPS